MPHTRRAIERSVLERTYMTSFADLDLNSKVQKAVDEAGYETPTPIQAGAIPEALSGRDVPVSYTHLTLPTKA